MTGLNTIRYRWISPRKRYARGDLRRLIPSEIACEVAKKILFPFRSLQTGGVHPDDIVVPGGDTLTVVSNNFPQNTFYTISPDGPAALSGDDQAKPALSFRPVCRLARCGDWMFPPVENKPLATENIPPVENGLYISLIFQSAISRKSIVHGYFLRPTLALSRFLPFARRRERTARPLLVLIRLRKPWSLTIFRLDG